ncbi:remorin-like [Gastrolobium bilobum]|uniref:remorin-like n=1 Tax=Gastrolobium bilobum TaxID=150636 RepID=UPI002AB04FDF|nr:remorin-like [Gastrolobium bilobum]
MEEEKSNSINNKIELQPESVEDSVPEEHSSVQEKESEKPDPPNTLTTTVVQKVEDHAGKTDKEDSIDRDAGLARVVAEKRLALIKAWEESEKTKAENRAYKKFSAVGLWEDSKKADVEAQLKKIEENLERKKAEYVEKMKNKIAEIHRSAEEKRTTVEAQKKEEFLDLEETAAKFRSRGDMPRKFFACFSG